MSRPRAHTPLIADSKSLHNYTLSPGWTNQEVEVLKILLMKYGIGKWRKIQKSGCLPSKTIAQMNLQTQRLLGQQSLAEFMGLHVRLDQVFQDNNIKSGPEIQRKNNFIINTNDNLRPEEKDKRLKANQKKYGLSMAEIKCIKIPKAINQKTAILTTEQIFNAKSNFSVVEQLQHLETLEKALIEKLIRIQGKSEIIRKPKEDKYRPLNQVIVLRAIGNPEEESEYEFVGIEDVE